MQNFLSVVASLSRQSVDKSLRADVEGIHQYLRPATDALLLINGVLTSANGDLYSESTAWHSPCDVIMNHLKC